MQAKNMQAKDMRAEDLRAEDLRAEDLRSEDMPDEPRQEAMNGAPSNRPADGGLASELAGDPSSDSGSVAERIGIAALELARRAQAAGLTTLGYLLESAALEAGTEATIRRWPGGGAEG